MNYYDNSGNRQSIFNLVPKVTGHLILINIILFIATLINEHFMIGTFSLFYPASPFFRPWQLITHMFMHGGFFHIFFNMYSLFLFGTVLERTIGSKKFVVFYFLCGIGAMLLHLLTVHLTGSIADKTIVPMLGASGAIYGLFIGYGMMFPDNILTLVFPPISLKAKWMMLIFVVIELAIGIYDTSDGVAHFAHLGGALIGFLLMFYWKKTGKIWLRNKWI
ncbi:MAG: rhomboid family intramembrane serine protease [Bacteroidales bacterium]|nr:rhomboid family intramembrane serine protease [Bacteroidales bacterium]